MNNIVNKELLGKRVKKHRTNLDMTQFALSEEIGVSPNFLGDIERGIKCPSVDTLVRIANCLKVSLDVLLLDSLSNKVSEDMESIYLSDKQMDCIKKIIKDFRDVFI